MRPAHAFAIGAYDYFAAYTFGVVAATSAWLLVPDLLPMPVAMLAGMGVGVVSAFPLLGWFSYLLGGFEIIVMSMQIGMVAGMVGVMMGDGTIVPAVVAGGGTGLAIQFILDVADRRLRGEVLSHD